MSDSPAIVGIPKRTVSPLKVLFPWQAKMQRDKSRFIAGCWSRQTGKDFTLAATIVTDCYTRPTTWMIGAPS